MKVCFYGLGSIGCRHLKNLRYICKVRNIPLEVHAVRSTTRSLPEEFAGLVDQEYTHFSGRDYHAIFITNPTARHKETIMETKQHSNCFFIEKPIFEDATVCIEELGLPKENRYYVAAPLRYTGVIQYLSEFVQNNKVYCARAISSSYLPDWRPGVDYRNVYSAHKDFGGGVTIDLIHEWDYLISWFGFPEKVLSWMGKVSDLEIDSEDIAVYLGAYRDKIVEIHLDYFGREPQREIQLFTQNMTVTGNILTGQISFSDGNTYTIHEDDNDKYMREMELFLLFMENPLLDSANSLQHAWKVLQIASQSKSISEISP